MLEIKILFVYKRGYSRNQKPKDNEGTSCTEFHSKYGCQQLNNLSKIDLSKLRANQNYHSFAYTT